jgi:parallel beta-helix repeat protein
MRVSHIVLAVVAALAVGSAADAQTPPSAPRHVAVGAGPAVPPTVRIAVTPAQPVMAPGASVQFAAAVTGTSNTAIDWSSTGGTISPAGMFVAGQTTGAFTVTAKLRGGTLAGSTAVTVQRASTINAAITVAPGQSIQAAVAAVPAGAVILIKSGFHRMQTITPKSNQVFVGEPGAVLSGARVLSGWVPSGSRWYVGGQTQQGSVNKYTMCRSTSPRCAYPEDLFINNVLKRHVASLAAVTAGTWFFDYAADRIYVGDNPAGQLVETSVTPYAFTGTATGVKVRSLTIEKFASPIQRSAVEGGAGWLLEDNEIRWNHGGGLEVAASRVARRNIVSHNGQLGIRGVGSNAVFEDNEIAYNNTAGVDDYWEAGGTKFVRCTNLVVRGNHVHHNDGPGLWTDIDNVDVLYENNLIEDNTRSGIFHEISWDAVIRNNTIRRNGTKRPFPFWTTGAGIEITTSSNVEVYGNLLEDNWQGITGLDDHRGTSPTGRGPWRLFNVRVHHNTVTVRSSPGSGGGRSGVHDTAGSAAYTSGNTFSNNTYDLPAGTVRYFFWKGERSDAEWRALHNSDVVAR